jgi:hypothetical protein
MRRARAWLAQTARPCRSAVALVVQRYGGMSLIVSASQRCSMVVSRTGLGRRLGRMSAGRQGRGVVGRAVFDVIDLGAAGLNPEPEARQVFIP